MTELMTDTKLVPRSRSGKDQVTTYIKDLPHVLWAILHVDHDGDGFLTIQSNLGKSRYNVRSRSGQKGQIK